MDNLEIIENLKKDLPPIEAVIGYGSGIYKQPGYNSEEKPDKDVIIITEDFKDFLIEDYEQNPHHFSEDFDKRILLKKKEKEKFYSNIGCLKFYHDNIHFKAMVISKKALFEDLKTWKYFGMAGRLTKPILYQNIKEDLETAIHENRENILITAYLLNPKRNITKNELYNTISKITYMYDFRTILPGEKKSKSLDIVSGAFDFFEETYGQNNLVKQNNGINPHPVELIEKLPQNLKKYIIANFISNDIGEQDLQKLSKIINNYFRKTNLPNSIRLAMSSGTTLGKKETIKHGLSKVKKHFQWVETLLLDTILLYFKGIVRW